MLHYSLILLSCLGVKYTHIHKKRSFNKISVINLLAEGHLMDVSIDGMKEIKLNFRSMGYGDGAGFDCVMVGPAVVNALRRS